MNNKRITARLCGLLSVFLVCGAVASPIAGAVRLKDMASVSGVRDNPLVGYGMVIGLSGTGDKSGTGFTNQSLASMLTKLGVTLDPNDVKVKNVASVMVTANLPAFARPGQRLDITISSLGDATTLQGGILLMTPLKAANGQVYAVAQGPISVGGFIGGGEGDRVVKNHTTVARISGGATVERGAPMELNGTDSLAFLLDRPDFATALQVARNINVEVGSDVALATDGGMVEVEVPDGYKNRIVSLLARLEALEVNVDVPARVVVNERTGTVVVGEKVRIREVAIAHGNLNIRISTESQVSQPGALSGGTTAVVAQSDVTVDEGQGGLLMIPQGVSLGEVVNALNAIGVSPRDLVAILQSMRAAGALMADLEMI
ncbi:MAG: flagellar basal body P-ring protein FlgI [Leptospirillia bacterium]